jgi:hypothetical protein
MPKPLRRTTYRDPNPPHDVRSGPATRAEVGLDFEAYYQPLLAAVTSAHGPGVLSGLKVTATIGANGLTVSPGVALDGQGRVIVIGEGGQVETGASADASGATPQLAPVDATGARIPTTEQAGKKLLVARVWETFDTASFTNSGAQRMDHTPWLQFVDPSIFVEDGHRIVLAVVTFGTGAHVGDVQSLSAFRRTLLKLDHGLEFRGTTSGSVDAAQNATLSRLDARDGGGLTLTVPKASGAPAELSFFVAGQNDTFLSLSGGNQRLGMDDYTVVTSDLSFAPPAEAGVVRVVPRRGVVVLAPDKSLERGFMELSPHGIFVSRSPEFVITTDIPSGVRIAGNLTVDGTTTFTGPKVGFLVDTFLNRAAGPLDIGDVVVVAEGEAATTDRPLIPTPAVQLATDAYDSRACGIVNQAAAPGAQGQMVTLGCWSHCKVDADISPIAAGDLLTTSPTPGHAQKVTDRTRAMGAVLGKALAPLASGKGVIPVLVSLH